jgi:hypothetical protein
MINLSGIKERRLETMQHVKFAQIWEEEQEHLARLASQVPEKGTIVEIGTAQGGTALIFNNVTADKKVKIFTVDINPSERAYKNLKNTNVEIIAKSSADFASIWRQKTDRKIDLLYIDGDHNFQYVFEDYNLWVQYLNTGGLVIFHDYDPIERGGLVHFGVRVCLDSIIKSKLLENPSHEYKLLFGRVKNPDKAQLKLSDCYSTFIEIGKQIIDIRDKIFSKSIKEGLETLKAHDIGFDSVQACYCIDYALKNNFEYLDVNTNNPNEFRRWTETLSIFEHAHGLSLFPDKTADIPAPSSPIAFSKYIAHEQTRLTILSQILKTFVEWSP